jgi:hypothetical protein
MYQEIVQPIVSEKKEWFAKQLRFTIFGPHIDHDSYMSDEHVSPGLDLMFMVC